MLGSEALAALGPAALDEHAPGLRPHPRPEAVRSRPLARLGLIGPLHGVHRVVHARRASRDDADPRSERARPRVPPPLSWGRCYGPRHGAPTVPLRAKPPPPQSVAPTFLPRSITPAQPPQLAHVWAQVRTELRRIVDEGSAELWLDPLQPVELDGCRLVLAADATLRTWIDTRFGPH